VAPRRDRGAQAGSVASRAKVMNLPVDRPDGGGDGPAECDQKSLTTLAVTASW
jgi:hypothetical protein